MKMSFAISTLGCKVNIFESEAYSNQLSKIGYIEVDFAEKADIYIINTCAVTNAASAKSRQKISQARMRNKDALICVVGCYAQVEHELLMEQFDIDLLIGSNQKNKLPELIEQALQKQQISVVKMNRDSLFEHLSVEKFHAHTRAFLKIQDGCNQYCSYCIIPSARGNERSLDLETAISQANLLVKNGHKEIVLTGIHTGRYQDQNGNTLFHLLKDLIAIKELKRIRISSIEATEITDDILHLIKTNSKIANHLHIPLQSGSNTILREMNRNYTKMEYLNIIQNIRNEVPDISISTDVIVGFPSESEELFRESLQFIESCDFSFLHVFPYSLRKNTKAAAMKSIITSSIKKERVSTLMTLSQELRKNYIRSIENKTLSVLVEKQNQNICSGYCDEYFEICFESDQDCLNKFVEVNHIEISEGKCYGIQRRGKI